MWPWQPTSWKNSRPPSRRHTACDGEHDTAVRALWLYRYSAPTDLLAVVYEPSLCVVAQGAKEALLADETYRYDPAHSLLVSVHLPVSSRVVEASSDRPCLIVRVSIDPAVVGEILAEGTAMPPPESSRARARSVPGRSCRCSTPSAAS